MTRRNPTQIATDLRTRAAALERKAQIASSPSLRLAIKLRDIVPDMNRSEDVTDEERALIDALDAYIGGEPDGN